MYVSLCISCYDNVSTVYILNIRIIYIHIYIYRGNTIIGDMEVKLALLLVQYAIDQIALCTTPFLTSCFFSKELDQTTYCTEKFGGKASGADLFTQADFRWRTCKYLSNLFWVSWR